MILMTIVNGAYKHIYNWGPHIVEVLMGNYGGNHTKIMEHMNMGGV
jgi:hypothetical protein